MTHVSVVKVPKKMPNSAMFGHQNDFQIAEHRGERDQHDWHIRQGRGDMRMRGNENMTNLSAKSEDVQDGCCRDLNLHTKLRGMREGHEAGKLVPHKSYDDTPELVISKGCIPCVALAASIGLHSL